MIEMSLKLKRAVTIAALACLLAGGLAVRVSLSAKLRVPSGDEGPWLRLTRSAWTAEFMHSRVVEHDLYGAREIPHPEDNRSPLFPLLAGLFRVFGCSAPIALKLFNLAVFAALFVAVALGAHRLAGAWAALFAAAYLCASPLFIKFTAQLYPDMFVALLFIAYLSTLSHLVKTPRGCTLAGLLTAAALLTKTTGVFLVPPFVAYLFFERKQGRLVLRGTLYAVMLVGLCLPWFVRNLLVWGSPLYQVSGHLLYLDSFQDMLQINPPAASWKALIGRHGLMYVLGGRMITGLILFFRQFASFDHGLSLALVPLAVVGGYQIRRERRYWLPFALFSVPYLIFMGYVNVVVWVHRFTMMYYVLVYLLAAIGSAHLIRWGQARAQLAGVIAATLLCAAPLLTCLFPIEFYLSPRGSSAARDRMIRSAIISLHTRIPDSTVLYSPTLSQYSFAHQFYTINRLPYRNAQDFCSLLRDYGAQHAFIDTTAEAAVLDSLTICQSQVERLGGYGPFGLFGFSFVDSARSEPTREAIP